MFCVHKGLYGLEHLNCAEYANFFIETVLYYNSEIQLGKINSEQRKNIPMQMNIK